MRNSLVNWNGQILPASEAKVSVYDRGFLYGDSLYEVARSYSGVFFGLDEHLERLKASAELCRMPLSHPLTVYREEILRTMLAFRASPGMAGEEAYCRLIVTRGAGKIGFGRAAVETPTQFAILMQPLSPFTVSLTPVLFEAGLSLKISERIRYDRRALDPAMKSGNYLNSVLAFLEAQDLGEKFDDALLCNADGHLTEGTTFNLFYVKRGIVATPPLDVGILDGITRRHAIRLARGSGIEVREVRFPRERLYEADEVFVSSSIKEIWPVTKLDGRSIADGKPGALTRKLAALMRKFVLASTESA